MARVEMVEESDADYFVLRRNKILAALIEVGYITNYK